MDDRFGPEAHPRPPIERRWQVGTRPAYVVRWFGPTAGIHLRSGGAAVLGWPEDGMGDAHAVLERAEPPG